MDQLTPLPDRSEQPERERRRFHAFARGTLALALVVLAVWTLWGFLPALAAWCTANGAVFVADEIQTGFARTGDWFACDQEAVVPDIVTILIQDVPNLDIVARIARIEDCLHVENPPGRPRDLLDPRDRAGAGMDGGSQSSGASCGAEPVRRLGRGDLYAVYLVQRRLEEVTARSLLKAVDDHVRATTPSGLRSR